MLKSLYQTEKIMTTFSSLTKKDRRLAAKMASVHMQVYVDTVVGGTFDEKTEVGRLGIKVLDMLKTSLDHIFKPDLSAMPPLSSLKPPTRMSSMF